MNKFKKGDQVIRTSDKPWKYPQGYTGIVGGIFDEGFYLLNPEDHGPFDEPVCDYDSWELLPPNTDSL